MSTNVIQPATPVVVKEQYAVTVRRARTLLNYLFWLLIFSGAITTFISLYAVNNAFSRYGTIVDKSSSSADAAQSARSTLLAHHSAAADYLSQPGTDESRQALANSEQKWVEYQQYVRNLWMQISENQSNDYTGIAYLLPLSAESNDKQFGEDAVFNAADQATWRYRGRISAMKAFVEVGDVEEAKNAFIKSHDILIQEVLPALNGIESLKLESMEEAYADTNTAITDSLTMLFVVGGGTLLLLILGFLITRFWLHYGWTWELGTASLIVIVLFGWITFSLYYAANQVEVLVRDAYDAISGTQSVEAYLTQAEALESMAIFDPTRKAEFLNDANEYLFLLEQRLCGELACTDESFLDGFVISNNATIAADAGKGKYGLPYDPLILNAKGNGFAGEASTLEELRDGISLYRGANEWLQEELATGSSASLEQRQSSTEAYNLVLDAAQKERKIARNEFNRIYDSVTLMMLLNHGLVFLFTALAALGAWGIRRRRKGLFSAGILKMS